MPKNGQIIKKLWEEHGSNECWPWISFVNKLGYGKKQWYGKSLSAHRWMPPAIWEAYEAWLEGE